MRLEFPSVGVGNCRGAETSTGAARSGKVAVHGHHLHEPSFSAGDVTVDRAVDFVAHTLARPDDARFGRDSVVLAI
jgi:hypothetical protein